MGPKEKKRPSTGDKRSYAECRHERVEENKKGMQQLSLGAPIRALSPSQTETISLAKVLRKQTNPSLVPIRRSSRVASLPPPNYKEGELSELGPADSVYASDVSRTSAIDGAERLKSDLEGDFRSSVKPMLRSHVTGGFWLVKSWMSICFDARPWP